MLVLRNSETALANIEADAAFHATLETITLVTNNSSRIKQDQNQIAEVQVIPNPSNGIFSLKFKNEQMYENRFAISIINYTGQEVTHFASQTINPDHSLNCQSLAPGYYLLRLTDSQNVQFTAKFIILP